MEDVQGRPDDVRLGGVRGRAAGRGRRADPPAPQGRRRHRGGQDQPARVRLRRVHRQPPVRGDAEPVAPRGLAGRLVRGLGGCDGGRHGADRDRDRRRRVDPHPRRLLRPGRPEADQRCDRPRADPELDRSLDVRPTRLDRRRRAAPAGDRSGTGARRPERAALPAPHVGRDAGSCDRRSAPGGLRAASGAGAGGVRCRARCIRAGHGSSRRTDPAVGDLPRRESERGLGHALRAGARPPFRLGVLRSEPRAILFGLPRRRGVREEAAARRLHGRAPPSLRVRQGTGPDARRRRGAPHADELLRDR